MTHVHPVTVRSATLADLPELQRLNRALFQYEHDADLYPEAYNLEWPFEAKGIAFFTACLDGSPGHVAFVAVVDGRIIGYLAGSYSMRAFRASASPFGELDNMFVEPGYRKLGVGRRLFAAFKNWLIEHKVDQVSVAAFANNHPALQFYRGLGFYDSAIILEMPLS